MAVQEQSPSTTEAKAPEDISRLDLRVGEVVLVKEHPFDRKYFLVHVDINEPKERRTTSRLGHLMVWQQLDRQKVVVLCNVKGVSQGIRSNCFIVFARTGSLAALLEPPGTSNVGDRVYVPGYPFDPFRDLPYILPDEEGKRIFKGAAKYIRAGMNRGLVKYKGVPLKTAMQGDFRLQPQTMWRMRI